MQASLQFLKKLKSNNNREWFETNKPVYVNAKAEYELFIDKLIAGVNKFDAAVSADMKGKDCIFRIYKDVRFSKDKTPYKTNFGASINPGGKKSLQAGYYLHVEPDASFIAGGVYMPEPSALYAIRQEIDYNPAPFLNILQSSNFKNYFKGLDEEDKLKTAPKGFDKEHPHIDILKNKHFIVSHDLNDKQLTDPSALETVISGFKAMHPFLKYLREAMAE